MDRLFFSVLALALQWFRPRYNAQLQLMAAQIRILRSRIDVSRIVPTPKEKAELLRLGALLGHDVPEVMHVVQPETYRRWVRQSRRGIFFESSGRPRTPMATVNLVLRLSQENLRWGYRRIVGELKKFGIRVGTTTVRQILKDSEYLPGSGQGVQEAGGSLDDLCPRAHGIFGRVRFLHQAHLHPSWCLDRACTRIHSFGQPQGLLQPADVPSDRRLGYAAETRNASMWLDDIGVKPRFLIHDRDQKNPDEFREFWKSEGVRCIRIPLKASKANSFAETWIESHKRECLNYFICFSLDHLEHIIRTWVAFCNTLRPHKGIGMGNCVLDKTLEPQGHGTVRRKQQLGGIIKSYYREAA